MIAWLWLCLSSAYAVDHAPWQAVLDRYRDNTAEVDYGAVHRTGAVDGYLKTLEAATLPQDASAQAAFWINAYNAITLDLVADHWPLKSIRDLDEGEVWRRRQFTVAGSALTLDEIENKMLRPKGEPRVHFVLNCAAKSCPPLLADALTGPTLEAQLEEAARLWALGGGLQIDRKNKRIVLSKLFDWYAGHFRSTQGTASIPGLAPRMQGVVHFLAQYRTRADQDWLGAGGYTVVFAPYFWAVNSSLVP